MEIVRNVCRSVVDLMDFKHHVRNCADLFGHGVQFISRGDYGYYADEINELVWFVLNSCDQVVEYREYVIRI